MTDTPGFTGHWDLDPAHSRLGFSTRHAMVSRVRGAFNDVSDFADTTDDYSTSRASVVMKTESIDTRSDDRDNHLRSADFFDVETYPEIRFVSSAIDKITLKFGFPLVKKMEEEVKETAPEPVNQAETTKPTGQPARAEQSERAAEQILPPPPIKPTAGQ